jgi:glycine oxidase
MASVDVTVRGAGIMGLSVAWACVAQGARVQVIDPGGPGAGASGGIVGALAPHVPDGWNAKKAFQLQALLMAPDYWAVVAQAGGQDPGFARTGRLQPLAEDRAVTLAQERGQAAAQNWGGLARWDVVALAPDDWSAHSPTGLYVHDTLTARIHPRAAITALAAALQARGVAILTDGVDRGLVVHATGHAGLRTLLGPDAPPQAAGEKGQAALLALDRRDAPQIFADGIHIVPQADGTTAIGSTTERHWDGLTTDAQLDTLIARARALVPALADAPVMHRWAGIRPRWTTRAPLIGPDPRQPSHFIANGGYKIGLAIAPLAGQMLADLMLSGTNRIPPEFLPQDC